MTGIYILWVELLATPFRQFRYSSFFWETITQFCTLFFETLQTFYIYKPLYCTIHKNPIMLFRIPFRHLVFYDFNISCVGHCTLQNIRWPNISELSNIFLHVQRLDVFSVLTECVSNFELKQFRNESHFFNIIFFLHWFAQNQCKLIMQVCVDHTWFCVITIFCALLWFEMYVLCETITVLSEMNAE